MRARAGPRIVALVSGAPDREIVLQCPPRYDLTRSLEMVWLGPGDPVMRIDHRTVWRATRTPIGTATSRAQPTDRWIHLSAWGKGSKGMRPLPRARAAVGFLRRGAAG